MLENNKLRIGYIDGFYPFSYSKDGEFLSLSKIEGGIMSTVKSFFEV